MNQIKVFLCPVLITLVGLFLGLATKLNSGAKQFLLKYRSFKAFEQTDYKDSGIIENYPLISTRHKFAAILAVWVAVLN
jgi:hypothetical protein